MKKNKRTYSLTAKERKALNAGLKGKDKTEKQSDDSREAQEQAMIQSQKRSKKGAVMTGAVLCVAVLLIIAALIAPVIAYGVNPYRDYNFVVARFQLSNGMVLEYVIEEDEYDIAATNFIFLAKNKYFDNTVLFDAGSETNGTDGWIRFGGYESQPSIWESASGDHKNTQHHSQNKDFCSSFKALPNSKFKNVTDKFGYDLYADKNGENAERLDDIGVLAYMYSDTSTEFQMSYMEQPNDQIEVFSSGGITRREVKSTMVGFALNDQTVDNLKKIAATAKRNTSITVGALWYPPTPNIYIKKVKVYNLDGKKWRDFDFIEYMNTSNENGPRLRGWTGIA